MAKLVIKEHQKRIAEKLREQKGLIAYHGLGSGKTIAAINAAEEYGGALVITPAPLQENFKKELRKANAKGHYDVYSYEQFVKEQPNAKGRMMIIDEAHRLRNPGTQKTKAITSAAKDAEKVLALTGTPIQNRPHEIAPLVNIVTGEETLPTSFQEFDNQFIQRKKVKPGFIDRFFRRIPAYTVFEPKNLDDFNQRTAKYIDYYVPKKEGFPTLTQQTIEIPMSKDQVNAHRYWLGKLDPLTRRKIKNNLPLNSRESAYLNTFINAQRQIANTDASFNVNSNSLSPKMRAVADRVSTSNGRSLIYSNYLESGVNQLSRELTNRRISHRVFTGSLSEKEKNKAVSDYNGGKIKALIVSSSGGEGLDLKETRHVHVLEPHWNDEKIKQVIGRAARYKSHERLPETERTVNVYRYISKIDKSKEKTADQYLEEMSRKKQALNEKFLSGIKTQSGQESE